MKDDANDLKRRFLSSCDSDALVFPIGANINGEVELDAYRMISREKIRCLWSCTINVCVSLCVESR